VTKATYKRVFRQDPPEEYWWPRAGGPADAPGGLIGDMAGGSALDDAGAGGVDCAVAGGVAGGLAAAHVRTGRGTVAPQGDNAATLATLPGGSPSVGCGKPGGAGMPTGTMGVAAGAALFGVQQGASRGGGGGGAGQPGRAVASAAPCSLHVPASQAPAQVCTIDTPPGARALHVPIALHTLPVAVGAIRYILYLFTHLVA
jgi:hypothetical protein